MLRLPICLHLLVKNVTSNTSVGTDKEKAFPWRNITFSGSLLAKCWQLGTQKAWGLCYNHETTSYSKQLCSLPVHWTINFS